MRGRQRRRVLAWAVAPRPRLAVAVEKKESSSVNKNELVMAVARKAGVEPLTAGSVLMAFQDVVTSSNLEAPVNGG